MRVSFFAGLAISLSSIFWASFILFETLVSNKQLAQPGVTSLLIGVFFFNGVILLFLGLIGEYISAIHSQVRKKPLVIEKENINF